MFSALFERYTRKAREFYREEELGSFWQWAQKKNEDRPYLTYVNLPLQNGIYDENRTKVRRAKHELDFIICERRRFDTAGIQSKETWHLIHYSEAIEIWESKKRHAGNDALPLRFGFSGEEGAALVQFCRGTMEAYFDPDRASSTTLHILSASRQKEVTSVDVAIWIDGSLRGSIVVAERPLQEGLQLASRQTLRDYRMKPVEPYELEAARIEVNVISSLQVPLTSSEKTSKSIEGRKGYSVLDGRKRGWYLPTVFNCMSYARMDDLVRDLVVVKAKIQTNNPSRLPVRSFLVDSFIEDGRGAVIELDGPVPKQEGVSPEGLLGEMKRRGDRAAEWIMNCQKEDGYIPLYADPPKMSFGRMDWPRLACTAHALAAYGEATHQPRFLQAAERMVAYIDRLLAEVPGLPRTKVVSTLSYRALAAGVLGQREKMEQTVATIAGNVDQLTYEPICFANLASLFALSLPHNPAYLETSTRLADRVFQDFERTKQSSELARFPELINAYQLLFTATGRELFLQRKKLIEDWLLGEQLPDGSFPSRPASSYTYTRGTGKIFEVLALSPARYSASFQRCFSWLSQMQYDESNLYFVQPSFRPYVQGGFRHDLVKSEAWIDAAAHLLLGISRILEGRGVGITHAKVFKGRGIL